MFKTCIVAFGLTLGTVYTVAAQEPAELNQRVELLEQQVTELQQQIAQLQTTLASITVQPLIPTNPTQAESEQVPSQPLQVQMQNWQFREEQVKFNTYYALDLVLYNGYEKAIKDMDARIKFKDLLGGHLYSVTVTENIHIPAHSTTIDAGTQRNGRLLGRGHQIRRLKHDEINAELVVRKIVFEDNSVLSF